MRFLPRLAAALVLTLGVVPGTTETASAAWDNVFQVCCNDCNKGRASYYQPAPQACPQPCPQPEMRISYVQRCYYQPVTEYQRYSYYEPVKKNVTSYYYEPVTEYKYTTYYDPCTGCPQKVCTPTTSYQLRSKCNSVTSYVQRCAMVPVTTLKQVTVQQPVVSYYYPPTPACPPTGVSALPPSGGSPSVEQIRENPPTVMPQTGSDNIPPTQLPTGPNGASYAKPSTSNSSPRIRPEKTVSRSSAVVVRGEVVMPDQLTPQPRAKLVFMNVSRPEDKRYITANDFGEFDAQLPAGDWYLYVGAGTGQATFHKKVSLGDKDSYDYKVVSR